MALVLSSNPQIAYIDNITGIYQDMDGTWYLNNGTPLSTYDPNTGAYQEQDGTWYTFQGVALKSYDINTGNYQENDGTWYNKSGTPIATPGSTSSILNSPTTGSILSGKNILLIGAAIVLIYILTKKKK